ncbi:recombinase family protein [Clostridium perfringens]|uniref:recombinase family protein n=1 Tax=Clostridium perfringens TaxID=1502 RepID=UPI0013E39CA6|nr:recombinase family protein [Clostridium perfringens]NGT56524.1 recombinase family protein [Clostridium perfringens]
MNKKICIYLRKSRADEELEKTLGEGETLSKHRNALLKFAKENKLNVTDIKEEIVSGDSLFFRPKMLELLKEVENNMYYGVLVMDIDRLGRGGMKDQGIILDAFKESKTKIITPLKTYDLDNEMDEEITEFKTFFSRRELKTINRRMQGGRIRSIEEGNYIATNPPYGYDISFIKKNRTLKINEDEAPAINLIFKLYIEGNGASAIANELNNLGYKTKLGNNFSPSSVLTIIKNPIYIGKIPWKRKDIKKSKTPGKVKDTRTRDKSEWIIADGKHPAIVTNEIWESAQKILKGRYHIPYQLSNAPVNPFAGIISCGICGKKMVMRKARGINRLMCIYKCGNKSTRFDNVESDCLEALKDYLSNYSAEIKNSIKKEDIDMYSIQITNLKKELTTLNNQRLKLFDLLERNLYDEDTFLERSKNINDRIENITHTLKSLEKKVKKNSYTSYEEDIKHFKNVLDAYNLTKDVSKKNNLLKSILYKIEYTKTEKGKDYEIKLFPKLRK